MDDDRVAFRVLHDPASDLQVLVDDQDFSSTELHCLECVFNTVADLAGVLANLLEVLANKLLLLDELDVAQGLASQFNGLVETVLATVGNIDNLDNLGLQTTIEQVGLVKIVLEIGGTSQHQTGDVGLVVGDVVLNSQLGDLADVVVTLFLTETRETQSGLTTTALWGSVWTNIVLNQSGATHVLLGQIDGETLKDLASVTTESTEQSTVTVHDNETELLISLEKFTQGFSVELVVTKVEGGVDGLERFEVDINLALLSFRGDNFTTVHDQSIGRDLVVELQTLLSRGNGRQHGESVHSRLNVGGGTLLCD